ncbi:hypothetical protein HMPREF9425_1267 [Streptococcus vestibularis ATCC 49124]|uniref:Uncharacterized protein n=1 Tax=Streptococcus vestibularis ATCC 49124 TaxID=889206 RepID=A0ABP2KJE3_STRVE|nr:hypothetical protein HMPREF9425_1267 [Streptococcus vestibularis ATCC 49124]
MFKNEIQDQVQVDLAFYMSKVVKGSSIYIFSRFRNEVNKVV